MIHFQCKQIIQLTLKVLFTSKMSVNILYLACLTFQFIIKWYHLKKNVFNRVLEIASSDSYRRTTTVHVAPNFRFLFFFTSFRRVFKLFRSLVISQRYLLAHKKFNLSRILSMYIAKIFQLLVNQRWNFYFTAFLESIYFLWN